LSDGVALADAEFGQAGGGRCDAIPPLIPAEFRAACGVAQGHLVAVSGDGGQERVRDVSVGSRGQVSALRALVADLYVLMFVLRSA
jgi:hypothetical protein